MHLLNPYPCIDLDTCERSPHVVCGCAMSGVIHLCITSHDPARPTMVDVCAMRICVHVRLFWAPRILMQHFSRALLLVFSSHDAALASRWSLQWADRMT